MYTTYRNYFRDEPDAEPPFSILPREDDLLLALWNVIVDREEAGLEPTNGSPEAHYQTTFEALLAGDPLPSIPAEPPPQLAPHSAPAINAAPASAPQLNGTHRQIAPDATPGAAPTAAEVVPPAAPPPPPLPPLEVATPPEITARTVYELRLSLEDSVPTIWRRVHVAADTDLTAFHHVVQSTMGWSESHLHAIYSADDDEALHNPLLRDVLRRVGDTLRYVYDFGDNWELAIELEDALTADPGRSYPYCTGGRRATPPEDVGGMTGYRTMLSVLRDSAHPDYEEMARWLTQDFHPASFSVEQANLRLRRLGRPAFPPVVG